MATNSPTNKPKVTPNSLETEELLELIEDAESQVEPQLTVYKNDILAFISTFDIQPGEDKIKAHTLYSIYKVWSKDAILKRQFCLAISQFFELNAGFYKINQNAIKLTHEAYSKFKKENRKLKSKHWTNHFENFLLFYSLKSEDFWIDAPLLYFIYDKYAHHTGLDNHINTYMGKEVFYNYANLFLRYKKTKHGTVYAVSKNILNQFQPDQFERMRKAYAQDQKKPKKQRRKPRARKKVRIEK